MANNFTAQPPAGRPLPSNWTSLASGRAQQADDAYLFAIENAWRGPLTSQNSSMAQGARLGNQPPAPAAPPRRDSRADTRMDGMMLLVKDDDLEQVWKDNAGRLVTIKKRRK